jgi:hypothetical protein
MLVLDYVGNKTKQGLLENKYGIYVATKSK